MDFPAALEIWNDLIAAHFFPVALCTARLLPITLMCPLFGGVKAPMQVRLGLALLLALFVHLGCGIGLPPGVAGDGFALGSAFARQVLAGIAMGYVASLPFDAARTGGRLLDTFRGANAEAALPGIGQNDSATAGLLHQLLGAMLFACGGYRLVFGAVVGSFGALPLAGSAAGLAGVVEIAASGALASLATGLAIGAPVAATSLIVDAGLGLAARAAPQLKLDDTGTPIKLGLGAAAILLSLGTASAHLLDAAGLASRAVEAAASAMGG